VPTNAVNLGQLAAFDAARDAVHIAIAPVVAAERLSPGQHVGFKGERVGVMDKPIGIVDPFLKGAVFEGERFYLLLYPNTVTSLRHEWQHPAFSEGASTAQLAEEWFRRFAADVDLTYTDVLNAAHEYVRTGEVFTQHDSQAAIKAMWDAATRVSFWDNYEALTGTKVSAEDREGMVFSCSC